MSCRSRAFRKWCHSFALFTIVAVFAQGRTTCGQQVPHPLRTPRLLTRLPEICPTPDGMALDGRGNIILACPNFADQSHPAVLMKIDRESRVRLLCCVPVHPETGVACPMGVAAGPDGQLYVADNQGWVKPNNKGRVLRLRVEKGQVIETIVIAHGMCHPNGVRIHGNHLYVTQSILVKHDNEPLVSGVYRFRLDDRDVRVNNNLADFNLLATFRTDNPDCPYGADGLVFDSHGNLFIGNFGDATLHRITFDDKGQVVSNTVFARDECMKSIDGICVDNRDNIYVADFSNNAICVVSPQGTVRLLAKSPDCDGSNGGFDQPGEPLVRGQELIVSNFDMVTGPNIVNSQRDELSTLSFLTLTPLDLAQETMKGRHE